MQTLSSFCGTTCFKTATHHQHPPRESCVFTKSFCNKIRRSSAHAPARVPCREDLHVNCSRVRACLRTAQSIEARQDEQQKPQALSKIVLNSIAVLAALNVFLEPALADLQTVPSSEATQYAKPIQKQKTDKGFVALLFAGGAASIFGAAVLLERNSKLFPAIHKANQVMREAEKRNQGRAIAEQAVVDLEQQDDMRLQRSVEAGLLNAQARVLPESSDHKDVSSSSSNVSSSSSSNNVSTSSTTQPGSNGSAASEDTASSAAGSGQQASTRAQDDSNASSHSERPKGSQLSADEKQKQAVNSVS